VYYKEIVTVDH